MGLVIPRSLAGWFFSFGASGLFVSRASQVGFRRSLLLAGPPPWSASQKIILCFTPTTF